MTTWMKTRVEDEYLKIEHNPDYSADEKIQRVIYVTACICGVVAMQPLPFADIFALTPIQMYMGYKIGRIRGMDITEENAWQVFKEVGGAIGLGVAGQQFAMGLYKLGLPFWGGLMTFPLVASLTTGIGKAMDLYWRYRSEGRASSTEQLKRIFEEGKEEGKRIDRKAADSVVTAIPGQPELKLSSRTIIRQMFAEQIYLFSAKLNEATDRIAMLSEEFRQLQIECKATISAAEELRKQLRVELIAVEVEMKQDRIECDKRAAAFDELDRHLRIELNSRVTAYESEQAHLRRSQRQLWAFFIAAVLLFAFSTAAIFLRGFR